MSINLKWEYRPAGPVTEKFMQSRAFVRGIMGPIGSGKSTACAMGVMNNALNQKPSPITGKKHSRYAIIRNTYPELRTTTIKSWHQWFPQNMPGRWVDQGPPRHLIQTDSLDIEVLFLALDRPDDIQKLLSLEITGAWINEAREISKSIVDGATGRVGRYPAKTHGGATEPVIFMDTNPPDTDHWWYVLAEKDRSTEANAQLVDSITEAEQKLRADGHLNKNQPLFEFFKQPGGKDPAAENISNLPGGYYERASAGKTEEYVRVYVHGMYGTIQDGKPVYPEYKDSIHCREVAADPMYDLYVGVDFGLTPAAVIGQVSMTGQVRWVNEFVTEDMGAKRFGEALGNKLRREYAGYKIYITGDPSGDIRAQTDEQAVFSVFNTALNLYNPDGTKVIARPAHTNDPMVRRESVAVPLTRMIDGGPGFIISPKCAVTRKGMIGGYKYKRVQVTGDQRFHDKPDKNKYSHPCEAGQYLNLGLGEGRSLIRPPERGIIRPQYADSDYDLFNYSGGAT